MNHHFTELMNINIVFTLICIEITTRSFYYMFSGIYHLEVKMKLKNVDAQIYIPDRKNIDEAISRTTHMSIAAHPDDIEIMSYDGIAKCLQNNEKWFFGIVVTNGTGSIKVGKYSNCTDNEYKNVRSDEQKMAADIGDYGALVLLDYKSSEIKNPNDQDVVNDLTMLLDKSRPHTVYAHNLADKHITHVAVAVKTIKAIRNIPYAHRPKELYGCEIWRSLDWMLDEDKIVFDVDLFNDTAWKFFL